MTPSTATSPVGAILDALRPPQLPGCRYRVLLDGGGVAEPPSWCELVLLVVKRASEIAAIEAVPRATLSTVIYRRSA